MKKISKMKKLSILNFAIVFVSILIVIVAIQVFIGFNNVNDVSIQDNVTYQDCTLISVDERKAGKYTIYIGTFEKDNEEFELQIEQYMYEDLEFIQNSDAVFDLIVNEKQERVLGISNSTN